MKKAMKWIGGGFLLLVVIGAIAGGSSETDTDSGGGSESSQTGSADTAEKSSGSGKSDAKSKPEEDDGCGFKATDDCTPHMAAGQKVRVDALIWQITSARTATELGDQQFGLGAKANGRFVIVKLEVESDRDESATLTNGVAKLEVDGKLFEADIDGTTAAIGADEDPFFLESIGPESTTTGTVVFDVPEKLLGKKLEMRFGELGFGSTKGYIRLPSLRSS